MYLEVKKIQKTFNGFHAARDVSFGLKTGHLAALLGPSGSGKTTVLRMIAGLDIPDCGDILINGVSMNGISPGKRGMGFVFQNYALFRYMTVEENIAFGLRVQKKSSSEIRNRVSELLQLTDLEGLEKRYPNQLSGGQRQRVAFARAIAPNPQLLLLDEPFAAIDARVRIELRQWLKEMIQRVGITSIFVTHDQEEAMEVSNDIIVMNDGRIQQIGNPFEIYQMPENPFVARFIGRSDMVSDCRKIPGFEWVKNQIEGMIRPENVIIYDKKEGSCYANSARAIVENISYRGGYVEVTVKMNGMILHGDLAVEKNHPSIGDEVLISVNKVYLFQDGKVLIRTPETMKA